MLSMMTIGVSADPEQLSVAGGMLEWEGDDVECGDGSSSLSSPLLIRGGGADDMQSQSSSPQSTPLLNLNSMMPETVVERTVNPDGSVTVKASTVSPHPNGYKDVKVEHYSIPADRVSGIDAAPGAPPPGPDYLTRVEYRVLSPGLELELPDDDDDCSTVYSLPVQHRSSGDDASAASTVHTRNYRRGGRKRGSYRTAVLIAGVAVFLAVIIGVAVTRDYSTYHQKVPAPPKREANETKKSEAEEDVIDRRAERAEEEEDGNGTEGSDENNDAPQGSNENNSNSTPVVPEHHHHHHPHPHNVTVAATYT